MTELEISTEKCGNLSCPLGFSVSIEQCKLDTNAGKQLSRAATDVYKHWC